MIFGTAFGGAYMTLRGAATYVSVALAIWMDACICTSACGCVVLLCYSFGVVVIAVSLSPFDVAFLWPWYPPEHF